MRSAGGLHRVFTPRTEDPADGGLVMAGTGRRARGDAHGLTRTALRQHAAAYVFVGIISAGLLAAGMLGAPLVSVLLIGILLVCPLLMWVPFRFERKTREEPTLPGTNRPRWSRVAVLPL